MTSDLPKFESTMMSDRSRTFTWAAQFLPAQIRNDLTSLYSFCRYVDDGVDLCPDKKVAAAFLDRIDHDLAAKCSTNSNVGAFLKLSNERGMPLNFAVDLVHGVRTDICMEQMPSREDLLRYSYKVAGTVGIMICYLLEVTDSDALAAAIDLGIAMQLTNIARDVKEDFAQNRIYLPASMIDQTTVGEALSGNVLSQLQVSVVIRDLLALAQSYYQSSDDGIRFLPNKIKLGILCASRAYNLIGKSILMKPERVFSERVSTTSFEKNLCLARSIVLLAAPRYHTSRFSRRHANELHQALKGLPSFDVVRG